MNTSRHPLPAYPPPATVVRPPWRDEFSRLAEAFPALTFTATRHLLVLAVPPTESTPERLVGVAALAPPATGENDATLFFAARARFAATPVVDALLADILAVADREHFRAIVTASAGSSEAAEPALRRAGFNPTPDSGVWRRVLADQPAPSGGLVGLPPHHSDFSLQPAQPRP